MEDGFKGQKTENSNLNTVFRQLQTLPRPTLLSVTEEVFFDRFLFRQGGDGFSFKAPVS
jgi:hypothetical protein